jgi:hypothetical protein
MKQTGIEKDVFVANRKAINKVIYIHAKQLRQVGGSDRMVKSCR